MPLGLPVPMFLVFVATIVAGSLGALHYLIVHVLMGRPFAEVPPPVLAKRGPESPGAKPRRRGSGDEPDHGSDSG